MPVSRQIVVILKDDVDGGDGDETVNFALDGVTYEIDLSTQNADALRAAMEPWISAGRRVRSKRSESAGGTTRSAKRDSTRIRTWAAAHGYEVGERGRIPGDVEKAYFDSL